MSAAVVTGGSRGLGRGICTALARHGLDVLVLHRSAASADDAEATAAACRQLGVAAGTFAADVCAPEQLQAAAAEAVRRFSSLHCWVNNAGVSTIAPVLATGDDEFRRLFEINVLGVQHGMAAAVGVMADRGGGRIVNLASDAALTSFPLLGAYAATKFAVRALTQTAAIELAGTGITVNAVCPGTAETDMNEREWALEGALTGADRDTVRARYLADIPAGRFLTPDDVGEVVAWLATGATDFITGQSICVNGATVLH
ncbi:MAG: SDR family NAD(P)-dependent oxidoreductase [Acidimicrobiia bacterium]